MYPEIDYSIAFMTGLFGSGHCIGMCGGLVSAFFLRFAGKGKGIVTYVAYHGSRISVYTLVGVIAALVGAALISTGLLGKIQGILQIIAGLLVILIGLEILGLSPWRITFSFLPVATLRQQFLRATEKGPVAGAMVGGVVNGLMPCSLTLAVAVKATAAGTPVEGGLLMLAFGLGTLPSMLFVSAAFGKLGVKFRGYLLKAAAVFVIALGIRTLYQGFVYFSVMKNLPNW